MYAYEKSYLEDAKYILANYFDYMINDCSFLTDWCADAFVVSGYAKKFEDGNPSVVAGMSGIELAQHVLLIVHGMKRYPYRFERVDKSPEYWAGWALAHYQWNSGKSFKEIFERIKFSEIVKMYRVYHEMDISQFLRTMDKYFSCPAKDTKLKIARKNAGLSQSKLADLSDVNIRNIQLYEQRINDIDKAQAALVYRLSKALHVSVEDILENPMDTGN